ncbi:MAG: TniB family NTP-binding protein [Pseudomonas sp.]|uniref:TniB family NTP-binding protein n=1 Tax=Pseudomonas sp. TaxID=306 RepID=UPI003D6EE29F
MIPNNEMKLRRFKGFTVIHSLYSEALDTLHRSIEATRILGADSGGVLLGRSGTGKTRLCSHLMSEFPAASSIKLDDGIHEIKPVIYCRVPRDATVKALTTRLLREFGVFPPRQSQEALEYQLFKVLECCQTELLVLDEWPHLFRSGSDTAINNAANFVKILTDVFKQAVLLIGDPDCEAIINERSALSDRFPYRARLRPFSLATPEGWNEYTRVLRAFATELKTTMGFKDIPAVTDEKMVLAFYLQTEGNFRALANTLCAALANALQRDDRLLLLSDFVIAAKQVKTSKLITLNPFEMSTSALKKSLADAAKRKENEKENAR